jgi:hypothetical protein
MYQFWKHNTKYLSVSKLCDKITQDKKQRTAIQTLAAITKTKKKRITMRKVRLLIFIFSIFANLVYGQRTKTSESIKKEISSLFIKADKKNLQNILTYKIGNKTGFIDAKTKKQILTPTDKLSDVTLFNPIMRGVYKKIYNFEVDASNFKINIAQEPMSGTSTQEGMERKEPKVEIISSASGFKGFTVNGNGELKSYSDLYYINVYHTLNVKPFKYKGKYYAIVIGKNKETECYGVIDTAGNLLPNFSFTYKMIVINHAASNEDSIWFAAQSIESLKWSFVSFNGAEKLKNELSSYPFMTRNIFGLNWNMSDDEMVCGILDIEKMEWILKPPVKFNVIDFDFTSKTSLDTKDIKNRNQANLYLKVKEKNKEYYIDLTLNKYILEL